jgi:hypothetical protein
MTSRSAGGSNAPTLVLSDACGGSGFTGTLSDATSAVDFESCTTNAGTRATTRDRRGRPLVDVDVDARAGRLTIAVGGVELSPSATDDEIAAMRALLDTAESRLVMETLWSALTTTGGKDPATPEMAAVAVQLVVYEYFVPGQVGGCMGCCGPGCWGCTGCYTRACLAHDACVMSLGHAHPHCLALVNLAALSAWCCRGFNLGSLC